MDSLHPVVGVDTGESFESIRILLAEFVDDLAGNVDLQPTMPDVPVLERRDEYRVDTQPVHLLDELVGRPDRAGEQVRLSEQLGGVLDLRLGELPHPLFDEGYTNVDGSVVGQPFHLTTGTLDGLPTACAFGATISM